VEPVSARRYQQLVAVTAALLALIVLTGATVRLTKAGLGCSDWPNCHEGQILPGEEDLLGMIEYGNRLLSGIVGLATIATVIGARRLRPKRPDLVPWAWGLIAGSIAQILLGAAVVRLELDPTVVAGHFLLSIVMLWNVLVLWFKSGSRPGPTSPRVDRATIRHGRAVVTLITLVLFVGTLVTGTGPNSGDGRAERLGLEFATIARTHSVLAWLFLAATIGFVINLRRVNFETLPPPNLDPGRLARWLTATAALQGAIGYWQYLTGVPPLLVGFHVAGSVALWIVTVLLYLSLFARRVLDATDAESVADSVDLPVGVIEDVEPV